MNDNAKITELSFSILEDIIMLKETINNKTELVKIAKIAEKKVSNSDQYSDVIKKAYKEMLQKLDTLSFSEIMEIKEILSD